MKKEETYIDNTVAYIKKNLQKGYNRDSLRWALINQGKARIEVDKAFRQAEAEIARESAFDAQRKAAMALPPMIEPIQQEQKKGFFARLFGL